MNKNTVHGASRHPSATSPAMALAFALAASAAFLPWSVQPAFAQETGTAIPETAADIDALFGDEEVVSAADEAAAAADPVKSALVTESVRIGGSFSGSAGISATWNDPWNDGFSFTGTDSDSIYATPGATIFFDARPDEEFRVYGSAKTSWPFSTELSDGTSVPDIRIFELFADFSVGDKVFFRFGKSTVKWGVGYFWSPADVINLESINVLDPEAQRAGPVSFRAHMPMLGTQNNFYLYAIMDEDDPAFETTALAAKAEFVLGSFEVGLGAWYRYDTAERAMATLSGSIGQVSLFGELAASRGSAKTFVTSIGFDPLETPPFVIGLSDRTDNRDDYFVSGTAGFMWTDSDLNLTAIGQYYYNGEGYADADREDRIAEARDVQAALVASSGSSAAFDPILKGIIYGSGRHYASFSIMKSELFIEELSASAFVIANLSDGSGFVKPTLTWDPRGNISLSAGPTFAFGSGDSEYVVLNDGPALTLSLSAKLGSGSF